ncbi:type I toxin-antitoxin system SymE family toxin [Salmonella enterica]|nr:type I toxin-antitoxin system SymE family toxin [Salmonella enterica]ECT8867829.1 type I toxin-antitoxin system SymE family toxin [Salmonella enterica subsp. enterica serovar Pensacola]EDQ0314975.1 type I toxin-antitoxin system SymE family toxin [Salmonella enterica subsp. enterica serovar Berta]EDV7396647.1 type I toxin-antitoxin system SymE family toxin [Salmonella enterica subsp. enterica]EAZ4945779.1 type I toxin-antitoxin system SymE family toxin [Salmonella enterica]
MGYRPSQGQSTLLPQFTLKGLWMKALTFYTGLTVVVTAEKG